MLSIKLFGGASLEGEDGPFSGPAAQRHRLALLALLAASHPRAVSRDKLVAYLWPESDAAHARNLLNQAVHALRRALGEDAILSTGDELRLAPGVLQCDVMAFEDALAAGDLERAVNVYSAPFLDGFFLSDAPEFERWMEGERERFRGAYHRALEELAAAGARADPTSAAAWWRRRAAEDPYNARVTRRLMQALEAVGDRAGALRQARIHASLLEQEFGAEPDPEVVTLAERMRRAPLRAGAAGESEIPTLAPEGSTGTADARAPSVGAPSRPPSPAARTGRRFLVWGTAALTVVLVLVVAGLLSVDGVLPGADPRPGAATADAPSPKAIAVLPFENLTEREEDEAFTNGIHSDLITALSGVGALTVISRASVLPYRFHSQPLREIGDELGVDVLLEGGVQRLRDGVRLNVQLSDARTGRLLWAESYNRELTVGNIFAIQSEITERIVASLEASLTAAERARLTTPSTEDLTAYQYYHQAGGAYDGTRAANQEMERLLRLALEVDPRFAPAWAALAVNYSWRPPYLGIPTAAWDSALVYAQRALELDPDFADAYVALATIYGHQGHLAREEHAAREALRRNPSSALAVRRLAESYRDRGAFVEALRHHRESVRLSPNFLVTRAWVGHVYADLEDHAEAERWYRGALNLRPDDVFALMGLAQLHVQRGQRDSALHYSDRLMARYADETHVQAAVAMVGHYLRDFERVRRDAGRAVEVAEPGAPVREANTLLATTMLGFAQLQAGDTARSESLFDQSLAFLEGMVARGTDTPRWPYEIALIHAARGDTEGALNWLHTAYDRGFRWAWMLEREPMLNPLRQDPRFRGLVARVQAAVEEMRREVAQQETDAGRR